MPPPPLTIAILTGISTVAAVLELAFHPDPFSPGAATGVAVGGGLLGLSAVTGLVIARGRWSRRLTLGLSALWLGVAVTGSPHPAAIASGSLAVLAAAGAAGPWLGRWLRRLPTTVGPPPAATLLLLLLVSAPLVVGLVDPDGEPGLAGWGFALWSLVLAFGLGRAWGAALWGGRVLHLPAAVFVAMLAGLPAAFLIPAKALAETALCWRRDVGASVRPLVAEPSTTLPIPPELTDPAIMRAAGLDEDGRPLEDP